MDHLITNILLLKYLQKQIFMSCPCVKKHRTTFYLYLYSLNLQLPDFSLLQMYDVVCKLPSHLPDLGTTLPG